MNSKRTPGRTVAWAAALIAVSPIIAGCSGISGAATRAQIATTPHCTEFVFPVYFAGASAQLTRQARAVIANAGGHAKGCTVSAVEVVGLADYRGPAEPNLELSRRRAEHVAQALALAGLPAPSFTLSAVGEDGAIADDGAARPLRRKVIVQVKFAR